MGGTLSYSGLISFMKNDVFRPFSPVASGVSTPTGKGTNKGVAFTPATVKAVANKSLAAASLTPQGSSAKGQIAPGLASPTMRLNSAGGNPPSTAGTKTAGKIPVRETMSAWQIPFEAADDIRRALDMLYEVETGTITGNDVIDIFHMHEKLKDLEPVKTMGRFMVRHGFNLQEEFNGQKFIEMLESVLQVEILKSAYSRGHHRSNESGGNAAAFTRVRLLSTMIHNSDLKKEAGTSAMHAQSKTTIRSSNSLNRLGSPLLR